MALVEVGESITLDPRPGFVVKTRILESHKVPVGTKVFINICHDENVPQPDVEFEPSVVFPLIIENQWEIPLILSTEKETKDKKGVVSRLYDCCINSVCFQWCQLNADLRTILIEWCIESVEMLYEVTLEREYTIPKMLCKGELSKTVIKKDELTEDGFQKKLQELKNNETLGLIQELNADMDIDEPEDQELPDLMNVNGEQRKPLIEELSDMRISEQNSSKPSDAPVSTPSSPKPRPLPATSLITGTKIHYELNLAKLAKGYQLLIKLKSSLIDKFCLAYSSAEHSLVVSVEDSRYYFSEKTPTNMEIPLPNNIKLESESDVKSYCVTSEETLYIFC